MTQDNSYNTENYEAQGGKQWVIGGNGTLTVLGALILPTSDPGVAGAIWNNAGNLAISAG